MIARSGIRPSSLSLTVIVFTLITLGVMPLECPPVESYEVSGVYDLSPAIEYSCAYGIVDLNIQQFIFTDNGTTLIVEPAINEWCSLTGPSASSGEIVAYCANRGICEEFYTLTGSFVDNDTWVASLGIYFFGTHEMCHDCITQEWTIIGTRVEE